MPPSLRSIAPGSTKNGAGRPLTPPSHLIAGHPPGPFDDLQGPWPKSWSASSGRFVTIRRLAFSFVPLRKDFDKRSMGPPESIMSLCQNPSLPDPCSRRRQSPPFFALSTPQGSACGSVACRSPLTAPFARPAILCPALKLNNITPAPRILQFKAFQGFETLSPILFGPLEHLFLSLSGYHLRSPFYSLTGHCPPR